MSALVLQLLFTWVHLRLWESIEVRRFRKTCSRYVGGAALDRLSAVYKSQLKLVRSEALRSLRAPVSSSPVPLF